MQARGSHILPRSGDPLLDSIAAWAETHTNPQDRPYPSPEEQAELLRTNAYKQHRTAIFVDAAMRLHEIVTRPGSGMKPDPGEGGLYEWALWMKTGGFLLSDSQSYAKLAEFIEQDKLKTQKREKRGDS